jgi:hypothetical protein
VPLAWLAEIGADPALLNPNCGAIARGHPARRQRCPPDDYARSPHARQRHPFSRLNRNLAISVVRMMTRCYKWHRSALRNVAFYLYMASGVWCRGTRGAGRLRQAAGTVGLRFLDHVIVTETAWARVP